MRSGQEEKIGSTLMGAPSSMNWKNIKYEKNSTILTYSHTSIPSHTSDFLHLLQAEELVKKKFPERIIHFNKLLEESPFLCENLETVHSDLKIPVPEPLIVNK